MSSYDLAFKEALKNLAKSSVKNQTEFVIQTIKRYVTSEDVKEIGIVFSIALLIKSTKSIIDDIENTESKHDPVFFMVYKYITLDTVNTLGNEILAFYEENKAASVDEICKGIEDIAARMQDEEYLDDKVSKFIEGVKVDKG